MQDTRLDDIGKLILRLCLGGLLIFHGIAKLKSGIGWLEGMIAGHGLPPVLAYGVYAGEVLAPILILIGLWTRVGALLVMANMLVAFLLVHTADFFTLDGSGGWTLELQAFFFFTALTVLFLNAGRFSVDGVRGRWG